MYNCSVNGLNVFSAEVVLLGPNHFHPGLQDAAQTAEGTVPK
jgi:hypothetical protein